MTKEIVIGTRDSALAMWQANWVQEALRNAHPDLNFRVLGMKTKGDKILDVALAKIGDKGLFTKELEVALLNGEIDMAVHSMKDLPTSLPAGLTIGAICEREYPEDVLISKNGATLANLKKGAKIGTSSLRRRSQLLRYRPDFQLVDLRGNLTTRLRKLQETDLDAVVLAYAGIKRLGYENLITQLIPPDICLPSVGQGSVGIEVRTGDDFIGKIIAPLDHGPSRLAIEAERALMKRLEGGCQVPIGALGKVDNNQLFLEGIVADLQGQSAVRHAISGSVQDAKQLGLHLAEMLLEMGADKILDQARQEFGLNED